MTGGKSVASMGVQTLHSTIITPPPNVYPTPHLANYSFFKCKVLGESEMISPHLLRRPTNAGRERKPPAKKEKTERPAKEMTFSFIRRRSLKSTTTEGSGREGWSPTKKKKKKVKRGKIVLTRWPLNMN